VKVGKPDQDMRFDVPTIGPNTIENLKSAGASALCVEAGRTLVLESARMLELATKLRVSVIGRRDAAPSPGVIL
jgi:DUF1009 family protein